jgi:hypothetical protein
MLKRYLEKSKGKTEIEVKKIFQYWEAKQPYGDLVEYIKVKSLKEANRLVAKNIKEIISIQI